MLSNACFLLAPIAEEGLLEEFLTYLGFIHANDHCRRNCSHCPAFGDGSPIQSMPFDSLRRVVAAIGHAYTDRGMGPLRSIASWRISDPFDYYVKEHGEARTTYDVAHLWRTHLWQGLYIVTNGTEGKGFAREALLKLVHEPSLLSQIKLTITPHDTAWGTPKYFDDIAWDVRTLAPLWDLPSTRVEDPRGVRFRINVKATEGTRASVLALVAEVLRQAGYDARTSQFLMADSKKLAIKPLYDLGSYAGDSPVPGAIRIAQPGGERYKPSPEVRDRYQYGIFPDGRIKIVDMYAFREIPIFAKDGSPLRININL